MFVRGGLFTCFAVGVLCVVEAPVSTFGSDIDHTLLRISI